MRASWLDWITRSRIRSIRDDSTQYLHDNWSQMSTGAREAMENQVLEVLDNYANNC